MPNNLAIVIPAYKNAYLDITLNSLSQQTNKNFTVYIGDDCSPFDLEKIIIKYTEQLNITYKRFDNNLGGENLVQQWNRCLEMMQGEEYFCLFSDDDIMEPSCIENFYNTLEEGHKYDVFHFDINIIDSENTITSQCPSYPPILSANAFLRSLYTNQIDARMPEFIFKAQHFFKSGGFINFDLAYRSDNATVIASAKEKGIFTIPNAKILWRDSGINISSSQNIQLKKRRTYASIAFFNWLDDYYLEKKEQCSLSRKRRFKLIVSDILSLTDCFPRKELYKALKQVKQFKHNYLLYLRWKFYMINKIRKQKK